MIEEPQEQILSKKKLKIDDALIAKIKDLSSLGFKEDQIQDYFGFTEHEWFLETSKFPEIAEAVMIGRSRGVMNSALKLREHINKGSLKAVTFFLETKGGFNKPDPKFIEIKKETSKNGSA